MVRSEGVPWSAVRLTIRWKLLLAIALPIMFVYAVMILGVLTHLQRQARQAVEARMVESAHRYAASFDGTLRELAQIARSTASVLEIGPALNAEQLDALLRAKVADNPLCFGAAIAFAPFAFEPERELFCPYAYRQEGAIESIDISADAYDYTDPQWEWYRRPKESGESGWTAPYFDEGAGNILMSTYAVPFFRDGRFRGVTTVDIALEPMRRAVGVSFPSNVEFFVITRDGQYVYHPDSNMIMKSGIYTQTEGQDDADRRQLGDAMTGGGSGVRTVGSSAGPQWVVYAPIPSPGWSIAAQISASEALAPIRAEVAWLASVLGATLLLIALCIWMASTWITRPLARLSGAVRAVAVGDLDAEAPDEDRSDEIGELSRNFNQMRSDLKSLIERRTNEQAASRDAIIFSLAKLAESRDNETGKHLERICRYVEVIAREMARDRPEIDEHWIRTITLTAALHDVGKVGIPDAVLRKPGKLTDDEYAIIKKHTTIGGDTLLAIKQHYGDDTFLRTATEIAFAHHERWDGRGYPFGLAEDDIALSARIVSVADVYDALTSKRVYKPGMSHEEAARLIFEGSGTQFDPAVVDVFRRVEERIRAANAELRDE